MTTAAQYPHLDIDEHGDARIAQTRYKVSHLAAEHYHHGWSAEELLRQHPDLRPEQIYSALTFIYDHFDEIVHALDESAERLAASRPASQVTRAELLNRRQSGR